MLIKEYRISLPMSVEEYRIAQLYMIQKKSRQESRGAGSGVEIIQNEPYTEGPGGSGQYTYKIYHIGSHLPGWFRAILPKSALRVEEEAWNSYPYTKTRYKCSFVEKFLLEVETKYLNDAGELDNVFQVSSEEMQSRTVDYIDIVKDPISSSDYKKEEDPKVFASKVTNRGPLNDNWLEEYRRTYKDPKSNRKVMTSYKLCRVEFKYWGMQTKIERFIHDIGLRKTMLRAHRQAWCWQDEYYGLQLSDIRRLERETQLELQQTMAGANEDGEININDRDIVQKSANRNLENQTSIQACGADSSPKLPVAKSKGPPRSRQKSRSPSQTSYHSTLTRTKGEKSSLPSARSKSSIDSSQLSDWRFQSLEQLQESSSDEEDEFFDAQGLGDADVDRVFYSDLELSSDSDSDSDSERPAWENLLVRSSSMETLSVSNDEFADARSILSSDSEMHVGRRFEKLCQKYSLETGASDRQAPVSPLCRTSTLFLVVHGGSVLDSVSDHFNTSKRSDFSTLKSTFDSVIKAHYPAAKGNIALRLVQCPQICSETLNVLSSLSPFGFDAMMPSSAESSNFPWSQEFVPLGAVALFSACSPEYQDHVNTLVAKANLVYADFLKSEEGKGFSGPVCFLADATGSVLTYDAMCRSRSNVSRPGSHYSSHSSLGDMDVKLSESTSTLCHADSDGSKSIGDTKSTSNDVTINASKQSSSNSKNATKDATKLDEKLPRIGDIKSDDAKTDSTANSVQPAAIPECVLRHPGCRQNFTRLNVTKSLDGHEDRRRTSSESNFELKLEFEVEDFFMLGSPLGLVLAYRRLYSGDDKTAPPVRPECNQMYNLFHGSDPTAFRVEPLVNFMFKQIPPIRVARYNRYPMGDGESLHLVSSKWWGDKRLDYMLYSPEVLHTFPVRALPPLFHASFWESTDVVAFVLRQVLRQGVSYVDMPDGETDMSTYTSDSQPKEKWLKKRTMYKVRNLQPNHRGNDVMVLEDKPQVLSAKFMYGPLDMTSLSGEKTDIHVMSPSGEYVFMGTEVTDSHGRLSYTIPEDKRLSQGVHPVKMVVRVDHTTADLFLSVLPPKTETVIFSIDGSFTASVSIMGKDPKVKPGAVDVVRHWQELSYLILYVTARPDMQHNKVVAWLAQHNFPHGMVAFMDGFSKDPLRQKLAYLKHLQTEADLVYRAGYGSGKDINVYHELGLKKEQIFIFGKASKKQRGSATFIPSGYALHLEDLMLPSAMRPASGNAKQILRKSCFSLPAHLDARRNTKRPSSSPVPGQQEIPGFIRQESGVAQTMISVDESGHTLLQPVQSSFGASVRARGTSPRPKMVFDPPR